MIPVLVNTATPADANEMMRCFAVTHLSEYSSNPSMVNLVDHTPQAPHPYANPSHGPQLVPFNTTKP